MTTMHEKYGDGSDHKACPDCGLCVYCGDCRCVTSRSRLRRIAAQKGEPAPEFGKTELTRLTREQIEECRSQFCSYVRGYVPTASLPVGSVHDLCDMALGYRRRGELLRALDSYLSDIYAPAYQRQRRDNLRARISAELREG